MISKIFPYVAMINQQFHRLYVDCDEVLKFLGLQVSNRAQCCSDCLGGKGTMLEASTQRKIWAKPPAKDGLNCDWSLNIEAVVCCEHHHLVADMTRAQWIQFAKLLGAKPFFIEHLDRKDVDRYEFDDDGNPRMVAGPAVSSSRSSPRRARVAVPRVAEESGLKTTRCQFCSRPHPMYGKCSVCYG